MAPRRVSIFSYTSSRDFLRDHVREYIEPKGISYRSVVKRSQIKNPNYLQQILSGDRNLTAESARKLAKGLALDEHEREYFVALVQLERAKGIGATGKILEKMQKLVASKSLDLRSDESIFSNWLHGVVWALAGMPQFSMTVANVQARLGGIASPDDISGSIEFLKSKKYIQKVGDPEIYKQQNVTFAPLNDLRRIEIQRNHLRYLDLAKLRLADRLDEREYQGLTISVRRDRMDYVKEKLREFIKQVSTDLSHDDAASDVMRIQCCAYWVTRTKE